MDGRYLIDQKILVGMMEVLLRRPGIWHEQKPIYKIGWSVPSPQISVSESIIQQLDQKVKYYNYDEEAVRFVNRLLQDLVHHVWSVAN